MRHFIRGNDAPAEYGETEIFPVLLRWINTAKQKFSPNTPVFSPTFPVLLNHAVYVAGLFPTSGYVGILLITAYGEFNYFPKNVPQYRRAASSFLGRTWGM